MNDDDEMIQRRLQAAIDTANKMLPQVEEAYAALQAISQKYDIPVFMTAVEKIIAEKLVTAYQIEGAVKAGEVHGRSVARIISNDSETILKEALQAAREGPLPRRKHLQ